MTIQKMLVLICFVVLTGSPAFAVDPRPQTPQQEAERILTELRHAAAEDQFRLVTSINALGPEAREAIPDLLKQELDDDNPWIDFTGMAAESVPALCRLVREGQGRVRASAVLALGRLKHDAAISLPLLLELARNPKEAADLRKAAVNAIVEIGTRLDPAVPAIAELLKVPDQWVASNAADALWKLGWRATQSADAVAAAARNHPNPYVRERCLLALSTVERDRARRVRALALALADDGGLSGFQPTGPVYAQALDYLVKLGPDAAGAIPEMLTLLKSDEIRKDRWSYRALTIALANCGAAAREAVPILRDDMSVRPQVQPPMADPILGAPGPFQPDPEIVPYLRVCAARAVLRIVPDDAEAFKVLKETFVDPRWAKQSYVGPKGTRYMNPREEAATGLGYCKKERAEVIALLKKAAAEPDDNSFQAACVWSLARLVALDKELVPLLRQHDRWGHNAHAPAEYASLLGEHADVCVPDMIKSILGYNSTEAEFYFDASMRLQNGATKALAEGAARAILENKNISVAEDVLLRMGGKSAPAVPLLIAALDDQDWHVRARAARALGCVKLQPEVVIPALGKRVRDERALVRARAIEALGEFGAAARPHLKDIEAAQKDRYLTVRLAAAFAVRSIREEAERRKLPAADDPVFHDDLSARLDMLHVKQAAQHGQDWDACLVEQTRRNTDRQAILERMRNLLKVEPSLGTEENRRFVDKLAATVAPSRAPAGSVESMIDAWIDLDCKSPGEPEFGQSDPLVLNVARQGFKAIPALIDHLNDPRLTRYRESPHVLNEETLGFVPVSHVAEELLEALTGQSFFDAEAARGWWKKVAPKGEDAFVRSAILSRLEKGEQIEQGEQYWVEQNHARMLVPVYEASLKHPLTKGGWQLARSVGRSTLPKEEKIVLFRRAVAHDDFYTRWRALSQVVHLDEGVFVELAVPQIAKLPLQAGSPDDLKRAFTATRVLSDARDQKLWETFRGHVQRADVVLRLEYLYPINWYGTDPRSLPQRLEFAAAFLDDASERVVGSKPAVQAAPSFRRLEVRDFAAWYLAIMLGMDVQPRERWTKEQWANLRDQVRQKLRTSAKVGVKDPTARHFP